MGTKFVRKIEVTGLKWYCMKCQIELEVEDDTPFDDIVCPECKSEKYIVIEADVEDDPPNIYS